MRTEAQLREAMDDLAATARTPESALPRILAGLPTPVPAARHNRRRVLVAALAVVLLVAAVAVPGLLRRQTAEPADVRAPGNWNLIHRVDLPAGWQLQQRVVTADSESSSYANSVSGGGLVCQVEVLAAGRVEPTVTGRTTATVNGSEGYYGVPRDDQTPQLFWPYAGDSWASVGCGPDPTRDAPGKAVDPRPVELDFAQRVVFAPTPVRLPFRLDAVPAGYVPHDVVDGQDDAGNPGHGVSLYAADRTSKLPPVDIAVTPGTTEVKPGLPGQETTTVDGRPAVLSATEGSLCLNDRGYTACVVAGGDAVNRTASLWAPGQRELVLEVASHLTVSKHLDDPSRWPDANSALPR